MAEVDDDSSTSEGSTSAYLRGLQVIELLAQGEMSASDVARELGVNRSTALRLLQDLEKADYVVRDAASKRYTVSMLRLWSLLSNSRDHSDIGELVSPILSAARHQFHEAAIFAVPASGSMVYTSFFPSGQAIAVTERLGTVRPMHCSALGKAFLAALSPDALDRELGRIQFEGGTPKAAQGPIDLRSRLSQVQALGYAIDDEETYLGATCVAVPVKVGDTVVGAAGISGPSTRMTVPILAKAGLWLISATQTLGKV